MILSETGSLVYISEWHFSQIKHVMGWSDKQDSLSVVVVIWLNNLS